MTGQTPAGPAIPAKRIEVRKLSYAFQSQKTAHGEEPRKSANNLKEGPRYIT